MKPRSSGSSHRPPLDTAARSRIGLNAVNFFQAEMVGVVLPVLGALLREAHWRYDSIGVATAMAGLGTVLFQTPAGILTDRVSSRRFLFAASSILTGVCFALIPAVAYSAAWVYSLLFVSGMAQSFFGPLLGALALALVGHAALNRTYGANQGWNHAGNIAAALAAIALVKVSGVNSIFYAVGASSFLAALSVLLIRRGDLHEKRATGLEDGEKSSASWTDLLRDRRFLWLAVAVFLFHLANAPILPMVALYVKQLHGSDSLMTATVLTAQIVMVPVALLAARYCDSWGRKPVMAIAFWVLPLRILSYTLVSTPKGVVLLQALDGIGAGIYGVAIVALTADLTKGRGRFNTMMGLFATALGIGAVVGPLIAGLLEQHFGFKLSFLWFAALATVGALVFWWAVPETRTEAEAATIPVAGD